MSTFAQAVRSIIKQFKWGINCCNAQGLTALDIALVHPNAEENGSIAKALRRAGAKISSSSHSRTLNLADYCALIPEKSFLGMLRGKYMIKVKAPNPKTPRIWSMSRETRNAMLVVAVLLAATTYQSILSPPGGLTSGSTDTSNGPKGPTLNSTNAGQGNPQAGPASVLMSPIEGSFEAGTAQTRDVGRFFMFLMFNSILFVGSLCTIYSLLQSNDKGNNALLRVSLIYLALCYLQSVAIISTCVPWAYTLVIAIYAMVSTTTWKQILSPEGIMRNAIQSETESTTSKGDQ